MPGTSSVFLSPSARLSGMKRKLRRNTSAPMGTLIKKIEGQPRNCVSTPPSTRPKAPPAAPSAPEIRLGKMEARLDRREGNVHNGCVQQDHELDCRKQGESSPTLTRSCLHNIDLLCLSVQAVNYKIGCRSFLTIG